MKSPHPDILNSKRSTLGLAGASSLALAAAALWAFNPPATSPLPATPPPAPHAELEAPALAPRLDPAAFAAKLWPPAPPAPAPAEPPVLAATPLSPLRVELLAIHTDPNQPEPRRLLASLYDPETGRVRVVAPGDTVAGRTVRSIDARGITLSEGSGTAVLSLRSEAPSR